MSNELKGMNEEVVRYLDGELEIDELGPEARREAEMWRRALDDLQRTRSGATPDGLEDRIMADIDSAAVSSRGSGSGLSGPQTPEPVVSVTDDADKSDLAWLRRPFEVRLTPLTGLLLAAALAALLLVPRGGPAPGVTETVYVQFVLEAPGARSVAIAGDFSEWEGMNTLDDSDGDGIWTGRVALKPGVHQYMFVVDGAEWVTDPNAERYADDGFGNLNAVIAVGPRAEVIS